MKAKKAKAEEELPADGGPEDGVELMDEDAHGQKLIPGTEVKVIKAIINLVTQHEATKAAHKNLTNQLESENNLAFELFNKHKDAFTQLENGNWIYEANGARLEITRPGEMKVKTKLIDPDD